MKQILSRRETHLRPTGYRSSSHGLSVITPQVTPTNPTSFM
ncbi:hypothetical protein [uncultured Bacteroides sp.]|nr:hypothetical protein [uncultured Bacteroides sp.]